MQQPSLFTSAAGQEFVFKLLPEKPETRWFKEPGYNRNVPVAHSWLGKPRWAKNEVKHQIEIWLSLPKWSLRPAFPKPTSTPFPEHK